LWQWIRIGSTTYTVDLAKLLAEMIRTEKLSVDHAVNVGTVVGDSRWRPNMTCKGKFDWRGTKTVLFSNF